jgi:hypothetical protein
MGIKDLVAGYTPTANAEESFDPLKGKYKVVVDKLEVGKSKEGVEDRYKMTLKIEEVISGDKGVGRLFFKTYMKDNQDKMKQFLDDLFTMGCTPDPTQSDESFEASFVEFVGVKGFVNAYHFKPEKDMQGNAIPADERKPIQIAKIYKPNPAKAEKADTNVGF